MKLRITKQDLLFVAAAALCVLVVAVAERALFGRPVPIFTATFSTALVLLVLFEVYRRIREVTFGLSDIVVQRLADVVRTSQQASDSSREKELRREYRQIEALFSLFSTMHPERPLPDMRGWAMSPDLLKKIAEMILAAKPKLILEAGSGVSTLVIGYCLKRLGEGRIISLEHDAEHAQKTQALVSLHGLDGYVTVMHAPLRKFDINGEHWVWYTIDGVNLDRPIDVLVVDGPPGHIQKLARYPALPLLYSFLAAESTIVLDDGQRPEEKEIVARWEDEFGELFPQYLELEKGAFLLKKPGA